MISIFWRKQELLPRKNCCPQKHERFSVEKLCPTRTETCRTSDSPCGNSCRPIRPDEDMPLRKGDRFEELPANSARMKTCRPDGFLRRRRTARGPILAGSEGTGHSPVFGKDRPLARCRTGKTHVVVDAPQGSLARCEGGLVRRYAEPYRSAPYKAVRRLRINGQSPKRGIPPPFATGNTVKEWLRKAKSRFSRPSAASAGRFVPPQHAG